MARASENIWSGRKNKVCFEVDLRFFCNNFGRFVVFLKSLVKYLALFTSNKHHFYGVTRVGTRISIKTKFFVMI